jgi:hypothetical protein
MIGGRFMTTAGALQMVDQPLRHNLGHDLIRVLNHAFGPQTGVRTGGRRRSRRAKRGSGRWERPSPVWFPAISVTVEAAAPLLSPRISGENAAMSLLLATARAKTSIARIGRPSDKPRRTLGFRASPGARGTVR